MRKSTYMFFAFPLVTVYLSGLIAYCILQLSLPEPLWFSEFEKSVYVTFEQLAVSIIIAVVFYSLFLWALKPKDFYKVTL